MPHSIPLPSPGLVASTWCGFAQAAVLDVASGTPKSFEGLRARRGGVTRRRIVN